MVELAIELKADAGICLYRQIYEYIKNEIKEGKLQRNEKLPSTRSLAEYLQVARSTVDTAYAQLLAEGYIEARPYKGYYICDIEGLLDMSLVGEKSAIKNSVDSQMDADGVQEHYQYDFSPHAISMKDFPFATWKKITKEILVDANSEMFALGNSQGDIRLRETICKYLHSARGVNCEPSQMIIGAGTDYLLMLLEKVLGRDVSIAMENPTYKRAYQVFQSFAYDIKLLPMDESGMDMQALYESDAKVAYVMPSHQYPTGIVMPIGRRMELLKWAEQKQDRYLIEDDYDSEFRYKGKPIPALQASDRQGKVIYMGTFSKSIAPAIRVGYMVLPKKLMDRYKENCGCYASTVSRIDQRILDEFIRDGYFERYLNKMRKVYKDKHDFLLEQLACFEDKFAISGANAGLYVLFTSKSKVTAEELIRAAKEAKIKIYRVDTVFSDFDEYDEKYRYTILLGYGAPSKEKIRDGVESLRKAWDRYL